MPITGVGGWWLAASHAATLCRTIRASYAQTRGGATALSEFEAMVLMAVGYFQPITRGELSKIFGKEVSRDTIGSLRGAGLIGSGPRSPTPGAPNTYVTTKYFLSTFDMETLRDPKHRSVGGRGIAQQTRHTKRKCGISSRRNR